MGKPADFVRKKFAPMLDKTLEAAVARCIATEFPRLGGPRIRQLCAAMLLEVVAAHWREREHVAHGQMVWMAVAIDDPPARGKRMADTDLVPVLLDVVTPEDIEAILARRSALDQLEARLVRLCRQAYEQAALLSNCDLAVLLRVSESHVAGILVAYETRTGQVVPRRATLHDVGSGLTHKRIICRKRYLEGKSSEVIARETYHSLEAVDRYLGQYDRVRCCRQQGLTVEETAFALNCSVALVEEYLALDRELEKQNA
jgi:hypothetical protein